MRSPLLSVDTSLEHTHLQTAAWRPGGKTPREKEEIFCLFGGKVWRGGRVHGHSYNNNNNNIGSHTYIVVFI